MPSQLALKTDEAVFNVAFAALLRTVVDDLDYYQPSNDAGPMKFGVFLRGMSIVLLPSSADVILTGVWHEGLLSRWCNCGVSLRTGF